MSAKISGEKLRCEPVTIFQIMQTLRYCPPKLSLDYSCNTLGLEATQALINTVDAAKRNDNWRMCQRELNRLNSDCGLFPLVHRVRGAKAKAYVLDEIHPRNHRERMAGYHSVKPLIVPRIQLRTLMGLIEYAGPVIEILRPFEYFPKETRIPNSRPVGYFLVKAGPRPSPSRPAPAMCEI